MKSFLFAYYPQDNHVELSEDDTSHPADFKHHDELGPKSSDRIEGYAIETNQGINIFDQDINPLDPYVYRQIENAITGQSGDSYSILHHPVQSDTDETIRKLYGEIS